MKIFNDIQRCDYVWAVQTSDYENDTATKLNLYKLKVVKVEEDTAHSVRHIEFDENCINVFYIELTNHELLNSVNNEYDITFFTTEMEANDYIRKNYTKMLEHARINYRRAERILETIELNMKCHG